MKPINYSFKRTIHSWFDVSGVLLLFLFFLFLSSCQKDEENLLNRESINGIKTTPNSASLCKTSVLYYGHQIFRRVHGKPYVGTQKIENPDFKLFNDNFELMILNGNNKKTRVSSAEIRIDGKLIVGPKAFSKNVSFIKKRLHKLTPESVLTVKLNGTQGGFIDLWIEGTLKEEMTVTDIDGNVYKTVTIGTQVWMAENLKTTRYKDGSKIPLITESSESANPPTPAYYWYDNDEATYKNTYGALYNWYTVNTGKLCPAGWHVPTEPEFNSMIAYLGSMSVAGGKLKEAGTTHWESPNIGATNETGFTALPGGDRNMLEDYWVSSQIGIRGTWWSSTENTDEFAGLEVAGVLILENVQNEAYIQYMGEQSGVSVRCIKDN
jgi:uncharacterized protein (TIGR02145 family)